MDVTLIISLITIVCLIGLYLLISKELKNLKNSKEMDENVSKSVELKLRELFPTLAADANKQLITMANEKLGAEKKEIKTDFENKRGEIERLVKTIQQELKDNRHGLEEAEKNRIGSFKALSSQLEEYKKVTNELSVSTENLKKVLSNNQLRGQFGEQVADNLLKMAGFVRGTDYEFNKEQVGSETRPDFAIFLPDRTRINIDSKFPYNNLQRVAEAENEDTKKEYMKKFERDVREKIKQVATRDYINPEDKTVDFAILFIPNEMIFSYVYDQMNDLWAEAMTKKVILAGPFSFTAILRMVKQAYDNFKFQENIQQIIGHVQMFSKEFEKFNEEFSKVGERITSLEDQYNKVNGTRMNQLRKRMEKVQLESGTDTDDQIKLLD
ncbi:hypothetical protein A2X44_05510 [candidate division CPR3 bacterium GWF2_35_18]|uniref:RmuC-domain protein n=1 Tax=candidate division CPR3 bacterium GW2011_GWF2_35_18 TaxID=1618350 RepID=A0A0G0BHL5_UNCC3|nr:MAG: hypothetical protein UR67_C0010G0007 [candidate division CPR3 bacterium GW2011_GWF2_35_18]OGB63208.1 MAG: hypothetical protein A2X44_05510 [candidate division CPR3 bacterium GWF2_35_18]OGB64122.1 MAG: hypothetical protein A2250_03670 [candidate division CPR3 bacterium RIFOXYA2_FULL_35_13]OGB79309.1 MAG: hypothetical protein A2296_02325 [candidate division CPR3 bacterium RIFOXYB2_FULL_35_8]